MKNWKVETTRVFGLEDTLNSLSKQGYEIYSITTQNHVEFRIIAYKEEVIGVGKKNLLTIDENSVGFHSNSNEQKNYNKEIIEPIPKGFDLKSENKKSKRKKNK